MALNVNATFFHLPLLLKDLKQKYSHATFHVIYVRSVGELRDQMLNFAYEVMTFQDEDVLYFMNFS